MKIIKHTYPKDGAWYGNLSLAEEYIRYSDEYWQQLINEAKEYSGGNIEEDSMFFETSLNGGETFTRYEVKDENN